ncbi:MAG: SIS domain-containing protein [Erysipelotrichaceae bacterium]
MSETAEKKMTMMDYVLESPECMIKNVDRSKELTKTLVDAFTSGNYKTIWIIASGSSCNGSNCARAFMRHYMGVEIKIVTPFTFTNYENNLTDEDFAFVISQSGYSTNSIAALEKLKEMGKKAIGITGNLNSDFKDYADTLIEYGVGIETVGYVTKGVTTLAEFLMLFALEASLVNKKLSESEVNALKAEIKKCGDAHKIVTEETLAFYQTNYKALTSMTSAYVCGFGASYGTAMEGALKIGETIQIPSVAYEAEEFIHGPNLQLTPNYTLFFIDGDDQCSKRIIEIYHAVRQISDKAFIITNDKSVDDAHAIRMPFATNPLIAPLYCLPFFQIIADKVTTDLHLWEKHPLYGAFKANVACKTENYINNDPE